MTTKRDSKRKPKKSGAAKPAEPRVKDLASPKEHAKGVRGGVKDSHDRYS